MAFLPQARSKLQAEDFKEPYIKVTMHLVQIHITDDLSVKAQGYAIK